MILMKDICGLTMISKCLVDNYKLSENIHFIFTFNKILILSN